MNLDSAEVCIFEILKVLENYILETAAEWSIPRFPWESPHASASLLPLAFVTTMRRNFMDVMYFGRTLGAGENLSQIIVLFSFTKILVSKLRQRWYLVFWSYLACSVVSSCGDLGILFALKNFSSQMSRQPPAAHFLTLKIQMSILAIVAKC